MHAYVCQPTTLITSRCCHREKPQLLCPVVKTLGFFLVWLASSPNPTAPYPKPSTQSTMFQKALRPHSALIILLEPGLEATFPEKPPGPLVPPNCPALQ